MVYINSIGLYFKIAYHGLSRDDMVLFHLGTFWVNQVKPGHILNEIIGRTNNSTGEDILNGCIESRI